MTNRQFVSYRSADTVTYASVSAPLFHKGTPKKAAAILGKPYLGKRLEASQQSGGWLGTEITAVLPTSRKKFPRYF
jgi:hypothetical protein